MNDMRRLLAGLTATIAVQASGCSNESANGTPTLVRIDSAGIEIVSSTAPAWTAETSWRLTALPILDIGSVDGPDENQLHQVEMARRTADGTVFVANSGTSEIRVFDAEGSHLYSFGGEGDGPGEFSSLSRFDMADSDTLYVWDPRSRRVSVFEIGGAFARTIPIEPAQERTGATYSGVLSREQLLVTILNYGERAQGSGDRLFEDVVQIATYGPDGSLRDTVGAYPAAPIWMRVHSQISEGRTIISLMRNQLPLAGGGAHASHGGIVHVTSGLEPEVLSYDAGGLTRIARFVARRQPVTDELFASWIEDQVARSGEAEQEQRVLEAFEGAPLADSTGVSTTLVVDAAGNAWLLSVAMPGDTLAAWTVLSADGPWLGSVTMPRGFRVYEIGDDYVLGRWRDDLEVEHVLMYGLDKG